MWKKMVIVISGILLLACSKTPLDRLKSHIDYQGVDYSFWVSELRLKTKLWDKAGSYCKAHADKPNCNMILEMSLIVSGSTDIPVYGASGHTLSIMPIDANL